MSKKIGEYSYVTPENETEARLEAKKHPKDRLLNVERVQKYEVTLQDMFSMRQHYINEALSQLKSAVMALRDYKSAMVQTRTWEEQITKAFADIPELAEGNPLLNTVEEEKVKEFDEICAQLETSYNARSQRAIIPEVSGDADLEANK